MSRPSARPSRRPARRIRRGNYAILFGGALTMALGIGAFSIDIPYMLMARGQAQGVADAAARTALITLRRGGDVTDASAAANAVVAANTVAGEAPEVVSLAYGSWDDTSGTPEWIMGGTRPNAVRLEAGRSGSGGVEFFLAKMWGHEKFDASRHAVAAARSVQVAFVLDLSPTWAQGDFDAARDGMVAAFDMLAATAAPGDQVSLTVFTSRYAWTITPWTSLADDLDVDAIHAQWAALDVSSRAGTDADPNDGTECTYNGVGSEDDFATPAGGCYPTMPRAYVDETGTDLSVGLRAAEALYAASSAESRFRTVIAVTGNNVSDVPPAAGTQRGIDLYAEARWPEFDGGADHAAAAIRTDGAASAGRLWSDWRAHTWVVSLDADDALFAAAAKGDGYFARTTDPSHVSAMLREIVGEFPLAVVE